MRVAEGQQPFAVLGQRLEGEHVAQRQVAGHRHREDHAQRQVSHPLALVPVHASVHVLPPRGFSPFRSPYLDRGAAPGIGGSRALDDG